MYFNLNQEKLLPVTGWKKVKCSDIPEKLYGSGLEIYWNDILVHHEIMTNILPVREIIVFMVKYKSRIILK